MTNPAPSSLDLRRAESIADLLARARELGVGHVLEHPLETLYELPGLGDPVAALLDEVADVVELPTIGDLVRGQAARLVTGAHSATQAGLLAALVHQVERSLPRTDLERWAAAHHVTPILDASVTVLDGMVDWQARRWLRDHGGTLRTLFTEGAAVRPGLPKHTLEHLRAVGRAYLQARADELRGALDEEAARLGRPPPAEAAAQELVAAALAARAAIREGCLPRGMKALRHPTLRFEADPPTLVVTESHQRLTLALQSRPLAPTCTCSYKATARCVHALTLFDLLLDLLTDPRNQSERAVLLAQLAKPAWARLLDDLDRRLAAPVAVEAEVRIAWRLHDLGSQIVLEPYVQRPRKGGGFTAGAKARVPDLQRSASLGPLDREVLELLHVAQRLGRDRHGYVARALLALVGSARVVSAQAPHGQVSVRSGVLGLSVIENGQGGVRLCAAIDGQPVDPRRIIHDPLDKVAMLFDAKALVCTVMKVPAQEMALVEVLARREGALPDEAVPALLQRLPALGSRLPVSLPPSLRGDEVRADERPLLRLEAREGGALRVTVLCRPLPDGAAHVPGQGLAQVVGWRDGQRVHASRDLGSEAARVRAALAPLALGAAAEVEPFVWSVDQGDEALDVVAALAGAEDRFVVEWLGAPRVVTRSATRADLRVHVADKRDWFGVAGELQVDGASASLSDLLAALRARRRYVQVKGDLWIRIGDELRTRLAPAGDHVSEGRGGALELNPMAAPALAELLEDGDAPRKLREMLARKRTAETTVAAPPAEVAAALRDYQVEGWRWLSRLSSWAYGACLADDMGVGKTLQALALLSERAALGPALVIAPTSVVFNWVREARQFTPSLRPLVYREVDRAAALGRLGPGDILVVSYGLLARDADELAKISFATLVLDEAQAIKNPTTQRARAVAGLDAGFRLALTGTPVENRLAELWSLFRIVVPGLLGSWERFRERFAGPIERNQDPERRAALARVVRPFILRRLKGDVARELPARTEVREEIVLSPRERALYDEMRHAILAELARPTDVDAPQRRFQVLAGLLRLRQLACHPRLADEDSVVPSSKLERCLELIDELRDGGHRALVFSQFTSHLALLREALDASSVPYLYLDGSTPAGKREELVDAFQRGDAELFLISLKAGGTGLNLTAADVVIHLDPWWNPAVEDQATDRAHRIGQVRPVTVYRLVSRETVEDAILELHADKRRLVAGILDGTDSTSIISTDELMTLLREGV